MTASDADLTQVVERDFVAAWWTLAEGVDAERRDEGGLRWYHTGLEEAYANAVLATHVAEEEADAVLDGMLDRVRDGGLPAIWWVMPSAEPADLADRLRSRGLTAESPWPGMAVAIGDLIEPPAVRSLEIRRVANSADLDAYAAVFAPILSPSPAFTELMVRAATGIGLPMTSRRSTSSVSSTAGRSPRPRS